MSETIPCFEPSRIRAGDSVKWTRTIDEYPASEGWSLAYILINGTKRETFDATASGDSFAVSVPADTTKDWTPGVYHLYPRLTSEAGDVVTLVATDVTVEPDLSTVIDARTHEEKMLDAISLVLEGKATSDVLEYAINGRSAKRMSLRELSEEQQRLIWIVRRQRGRVSNTVGVTFGGTSW